MMRYSIEPRHQIFVKGCRIINRLFLPFAKNKGKNITKIRSKKIKQ